MNAEETSASKAIADWTPLAVVCRSRITAEIETFISDVSTTSTNIAIASRIARRFVLPGVTDSSAVVVAVTRAPSLPARLNAAPSPQYSRLDGANASPQRDDHSWRAAPELSTS